jgi:exodeoxyribonuclease VII small subunit
VRHSAKKRWGYLAVVDEQPKETPAGQPSFEHALARLETIIQELEEGEVGLAEGLARYEEGVKLLRECYQQLESAQRRVELLSRVDADGLEVCEPFDETAQSLEEKAQTRGRRRSRPTEPEPGASDEEDDRPGRLF